MKIKDKEKENTAPNKRAEKPKKKAPADDFKRKYFEFYDDVKISDRQDW